MSSGRTLTPEEKLEIDLSNLLTAANALMNGKDKSGQTDKLLIILRSFVVSKASDDKKNAALMKLIVNDKNNLYLIELTFANLPNSHLIDPLTQRNIITPFLQNVKTLKAEVAEKKATLTISRGRSSLSEPKKIEALQTALSNYIADNDPKNRNKNLAEIAQKISTLSHVDEKAKFKLTPQAENKILEIINDPLRGEVHRKALKAAYSQADYLGTTPAFLDPPMKLGSHRTNLFQPLQSEATKKLLKTDAAPAPREIKEFDKKTTLGPGYKK